MSTDGRAQINIGEIYQVQQWAIRYSATLVWVLQYRASLSTPQWHLCHSHLEMNPSKEDKQKSDKTYRARSVSRIAKYITLAQGGHWCLQPIGKYSNTGKSSLRGDRSVDRWWVAWNNNRFPEPVFVCRTSSCKVTLCFSMAY